jgi:methionine synthase / methylenetetrahydrofolate reductase(NADPH)
MTQPVFSAGRVREVTAACAGIEAMIFIGVYPLISPANAEFMANEVPGITIPEEVKARLAAAGDRAARRRVGLEIAAELIEEIKEEIDGLYLVSPLNLWSIPRELVRRVRSGEKTKALD